jgi:hypothetical protein
VRLIFATALLSAVFAASCVGNIGDGSEGETAPGVIDPDLVPAGGLRRHTTAEYFNTVRDLLSNETLPVYELLPADPRTPFDNDFLEQVASQGLIDSADFLAERAADDLLLDTARRDAVVGCTPTGPSDEACMRSFVTAFGRRALRRPLTEEEIDEYVLGIDGVDGALGFAVEDDDFYTGVHSVVWSMLQDVEFLYRIEIGTEVEGQAGVHRLTDFEIASRLSYFVWGSMPDDALLDRAEAGELDTAEQRRAVASRLLEDPRALQRMSRFHAMWLGYELLPYGGELGTAMRAETNELMKRVIFDDKRPWQDLFRFEETFANDFLADHYGLPAPGSTSGAWISYADSGRAGLLSHGSFLSIGAKFNDTSIVQRGLVIRERLFCQDIADPPPTVDVDEPVVVENAICKPERFAAHSTGGCASCHQLIDPLGMGLENYDQFGVYRTNEPDNPDTAEDETQCVIEGQGEFEYGQFKGPAELGALAISSGVINDCLAEQLYRFVTGRSELDSVDRRVVLAVQDNMGAEEFTFDALVLEVVGHESFGFRSQE